MPSETDILNDALGQIGASPITAIDDGTVNANYCQTFYPMLRDSLLMQNEWTFAKKRVQLALNATAPVFEFSYAYTLPSDYLKLVEYLGDTPTPVDLSSQTTGTMYERYKIEGNTLVTNDATVYILYLARVTDPNLWGPLFYQGLATWLASKLASAIAKDAKTAMALLQMAMTQLTEAMAVDGQQDSIEPMRTLDLKWGR